MISLNQTEQQFIAYLDTFSRSLTPPVECRIAGGWVRDKILSLPSNDLDIALTIPSGHTFAVGFVEYLKSQGITTGSVGKVAVNPEQSKHLETGTTKILGLECDFVGLRSETYADTRIPEVRPGTPLEDASRRDLTINALFYNVHSREVEDHTGKGLSDLENRIARTPLAPLQTFHDDPLRVIRCVRFASRFDLSIEPDVAEAIRDAEITAALRTKVSKERIGIEITKMIQKTPYSALTLITQLGLQPAVFTCPGLDVDPPRDEVETHCEILHELPEHGHEVHPYHWFAAATKPFEGKTVKVKREVPAVAHVISEGLKLGNDVRDGVAKLFEAAALIDPSATKRSIIGTMLQHPSVRPWDRSIVWAIVSAIRPVWSGKWDDNAAAVLERYDAFIRRIHELNLPADIDKAPVLDGNAIKNVLQIKPSPILTFIRNAVNEWQLDNPEGTREDAEAWLLDRWNNGGREEWEAQASKVTSKGKKK